MWPFPVNIRAFAPFKQFGGYFDGDNGGYSTSMTATSRVAQNFTVDPAKGTHTNPNTFSSPSHHPWFGTATAKDDKGSITNFKSTENNDGSNTVSFTSNMAGHLPLIPSADINVMLTLRSLKMIKPVLYKLMLYKLVTHFQPLKQ
ncbi:hypothetical protein [Mucilaginibacter sp.]|uniref:hypothetical protein n=1 Tax=Mucilaginibacter sp. TaxID=1882438 RepID=UPI0035BC7D45